VTLIQRFGSALNLNIHLHMLFLDGAYLSSTQPPAFRSIAAPSQQELQALLVRIAERIGRALERKGLLMREGEHRFLATDPETSGPLHDLIGHSITYRVAITPAGRGRGAKMAQDADSEPSPLAKHVRMSWAQRLARVFAIDIEHCLRCGGQLKVIASIQAPVLIERILTHLKQQAPAAQPSPVPFAARAPPQQRSLF
jgi:hypothetical protein